MHDAMPHDAVAAAISLAPHIRAVREELETTRRVPPPWCRPSMTLAFSPLSAACSGRPGTAPADGLSRD